MKLENVTSFSPCTQSNAETCRIPRWNWDSFKDYNLYDILGKNQSLFEILVLYSTISVSWVYQKAQQVHKKGQAHTQVIYYH